jgi:hypothetical protein
LTPADVFNVFGPLKIVIVIRTRQFGRSGHFWGIHKIVQHF